MVTYPILVPFDGENAARLPISATKQHKVIDFAIEQTSDIPTITKDEVTSCSIIRETIWNIKIEEEIAEVITESWRHTTNSKYEAILTKWKFHALSRNEDHTDISVENVFFHFYMLCTRKAVHIIGCVELEVPYLVLYVLRDFQRF